MNRIVPAMLLMGLPAVAGAQRVHVAVDCRAARLAGAERATCASPALMRLTAQVDSATRALEPKLGGREREILLDTEWPFMVARNGCQNIPGSISACVERVLRGRLAALAAASQSPGTIQGELARYPDIGLAFVEKWSDALVGKHVAVWGCMTLDPGRVQSRRTRGEIRTACTRQTGPVLAARFKSMTADQATYFFWTPRAGYWRGTLERRDGALVLVDIVV